MNRGELIKSIEERIQLALVISIFFPSLLSTFFSSAKEATLGLVSKSTLPEFMLVGIYLFCYAVFQSIKRKKIPDNLLRFINTLVLGGIVFFIIPIIFFATMDPNMPIASLNWFSFAMLHISTWGLPISAGIIVLAISFVFGLSLGGAFSE